MVYDLKLKDNHLQLEQDLNFAHLQAVLARLDVLIRREVTRWQRAGQDPTDTFRGLYVSDAQAEALLSRPLATSWGQVGDLRPEEQATYTDFAHATERQIQHLTVRARDQGITLRLEHLADVFGLDQFDLDALLICLARCLDLRYERLYGYLQDDVTQKRPSVNLILDLLCKPGLSRMRWINRFAADGPLMRYRLLERITQSGRDHPGLLGQTLDVDDTVVAWLLGSYQPQKNLADHVQLDWVTKEKEDQLLAAKLVAEVEKVLPGKPVLVFTGPDETAQRSAARLISLQTRQPLLSVDLQAIIDEEVDAFQGLVIGLRDARLTGAIAYFSGWDAILSDRTVPTNFLNALMAHPDVAIVSGKSIWEPGGVARQRRLIRVAFPLPNYLQRLVLFQNFLGESMPSNDPGPKAVATRFHLSSAQIRDAVATAKDQAAKLGRPLCREDLFSAARAHSSPRLSNTARKITPRYQWGDIVLPQDQLALLREIVATVRERSKVLEEWGVGRKLASSRGVSMLFAGPPGTGKTMAAEITAGELGLDLYKIDLSTIVSKYIGETEKNLERVFSDATNSNAILFFDEADALFGKRSEVRDSHDRYANIEISYLLQRMEAYDGVTILATNLRANLDEAFTRRLQFAVDFPFPEEEDRLRIWQALFPPGVPRSDELDLPLLARRYKLAGGNIRNILVNAAYLAASDGGAVSMQHLLHGTRRELQKMGRLVEVEDLRLPE